VIAGYTDKVVIVTGASSGIGYVTAQSFARRGARVVAVARREERLRQLIREFAPFARGSFYLCGDLGSQAFAEHIIDETIARCGRVDILINNAAISKHKQIYDITAADVDGVLRVNFMACAWTTLKVLPYFLRQGGGTIVNISSFAAKVAPPREAVYAASKAAMTSFSEGLWNDLNGSNIHVALIHPGPIDTEIWDKLDDPSTYRGRKYPPQLVADAIFDTIENRRFEMTLPRRNPQLALARLLRLWFPALLRFAMARIFPVAPEVVAAARRKARHPS